jgi:hypothetical protein
VRSFFQAVPYIMAGMAAVSSGVAMVLWGEVEMGL